MSHFNLGHKLLKFTAFSDHPGLLFATVSILLKTKKCLIVLSKIIICFTLYLICHLHVLI